MDKFKCYNIHALMHPFIDRQPANRVKLFPGYMIYDVFCPILSKSRYTYFASLLFSFLVFH